MPSELQGQTAVTATLEQIDIVHRMMRKYPDTFELALTADDVERIFKKGKIASLIGMEGGHSIDNSLGSAAHVPPPRRALHDDHPLEERRRGPTRRPTPRRSAGLSPFGEEVIREMNWLGMLVDLSHVSPDTMADAIAVSEAPVIFSHSSARALNDVPRNVPDNVLQMLPKNGGVVMVTFVPGFLSPKVAAWNKLQTAETARLQQQFPSRRGGAQGRARRVDEGEPGAARDDRGHGRPHRSHPQGRRHRPHRPRRRLRRHHQRAARGSRTSRSIRSLTAELLRRGYKDEDVKKILGLNILRVMRGAKKVAAKLQAARPPSSVAFQVTGPRIRIVALGDSTTAGTPGWKSPHRSAAGRRRATRRSQYAYWLMQAHPEWEVLNHGVNGERSDQIRGRFEQRSSTLEPRAVVIIAGVNDVYQGREAQHVIEQLAAMYERAKPQRASPVGGRDDRPLQHGDGRAERADERDQRLDSRVRGRERARRVRRHACGRGGARRTRSALRIAGRTTSQSPRDTGGWPTPSVRCSSGS